MSDSGIEAVVIHPVFSRRFVVAEHPEGELPWPGDALGCDCMVVARTASGWTALYQNDGSNNEDWIGWHAEVLAPFDGVVERVTLNEITNQPGIPASEPTASIVFRRSDGVRVMYGHLDNITVKPGDTVAAGLSVGLCGNNGYSMHPHVHAGAWLDETPLQIRFDLVAMGRLQRENTGWYG